PQQSQPHQRPQQGQSAEQRQRRAQFEQPAPPGNRAGQPRSYTPPQRSQQQAQSWQQQSSWRRQGGWQGNSTWQQDRARNWQNEHRTWAQRGGYGGYYIPQDRFSLYFGTRHPFQIQNRPLIVAGYPRFQYGGFWFMMVDPWPEYWSDNWYASDDVYIDYNDDGYYLYNRTRPGPAIAITVVL